MSAARATAEACEFHGEHGVIGERLRQIESREDKQDGQIAELTAGQGGIREEIAGLRGELRGALNASKMAGAVIGGLASMLVSGLGAALIYLLNRGK